MSSQPRERPPSIIDSYADILQALDPRRRRGLIARLAHGYYEGWRPDRAEVTDLVAVELGLLTSHDSKLRQQRRNEGYPVPDIDVLSRERGAAPFPGL